MIKNNFKEINHILILLLYYFYIFILLIQKFDNVMILKILLPKTLQCEQFINHTSRPFEQVRYLAIAFKQKLKNVSLRLKCVFYL